MRSPLGIKSPAERRGSRRSFNILTARWLARMPGARFASSPGLAHSASLSVDCRRLTRFCTEDAMVGSGTGHFRVAVQIGNRAGERFAPIEALVDTGATYTWIPRDVLTTLGVTPEEEWPFVLADGREVRYPVAWMLMRIGERTQPTIVVFGEPGTDPRCLRAGGVPPGGRPGESSPDLGPRPSQGRFALGTGCSRERGAGSPEQSGRELLPAPGSLLPPACPAPCSLTRSRPLVRHC